MEDSALYPRILQNIYLKRFFWPFTTLCSQFYSSFIKKNPPIKDQMLSLCILIATNFQITSIYWEVWHLPLYFNPRSTQIISKQEPKLQQSNSRDHCFVIPLHPFIHFVLWNLFISLNLSSTSSYFIISNSLTKYFQQHNPWSLSLVLSTILSLYFIRCSSVSVIFMVRFNYSAWKIFYYVPLPLKMRLNHLRMAIWRLFDLVFV